MLAEESQTNDCSGVGAKWKLRPGRWPRKSKAARITHMKAVCAAEVPAVWTMLFSQRLKSRKKMPSIK